MSQRIFGVIGPDAPLANRLLLTRFARYSNTASCTHCVKDRLPEV
jgi:hypothetical protein